MRFFFKKKKWTPLEWNTIAKNTLQAINDLHNIGVFHRDIKPENFMWCSQKKNIILLDFGLSTLITSNKKPSWVGTPKFASPWIGQGKPYSKKDDLSSWWIMMLWGWNKGIVPWNCLIGKKKLNKLETKNELKKLQKQKQEWLTSFFQNIPNTDLPDWFITKGKKIHQDSDCVVNPRSI